MCTQVRLEGLDEALPLDKEEGSSAYRQQTEQLQRNEFFRDCMAPINADFKVLPLASYPFGPVRESVLQHYSPLSSSCLADVVSIGGYQPEVLPVVQLSADLL